MKKEQINVPKLRFPKYTASWKQQKFSEFTWSVSKRNKDNLELEPYAITNDRGFIPQSEAHDDFGYMQDVDRKAYSLVPPKSFAYNPARINVGSIGYYDGTENVIVSSLYEVFQTADYVDDRFLWHWIKSDIFPRWIEKLQEGSVRLYFYYDKLCECHIQLPSIDEQRQISTFLDKYDTLITLQQCKLDQIKEYKKGMLQKMFPKDGETVPEVRFPGFSGEWELRKLGDVTISFEYGLNAAAKAYDGQNKYIRITDINDESHEFMQDEITSPDTDLLQAENYRLKEGDILFARTGASVGKSYLYKATDGLVYFAGFLIRARIKKEYNSSFIFQNTLTQKYKNYIAVTSQRSGQPGVNAQEYSQYTLMVPNRREQDKLSELFQSLDSLISLQQRKLDAMKEYKKGLLQQMFV